MEKSQYDIEAPAPLAATVSQVGEITKEQQVDAVFGAVTEDGPNYRAVGYIDQISPIHD